MQLSISDDKTYKALYFASYLKMDLVFAQVENSSSGDCLLTAGASAVWVLRAVLVPLQELCTSQTGHHLFSEA